MKREELNKLVGYIESNIRANDKSGLDYIDPRNFVPRLKNKQNHVIFGRRGSGKTTLIKTLDNIDDIILIKLNVEDFKGVSFPNIIIHVLRSFFKRLKPKLRKKIKWYQFYKWFKVVKLQRKIENLVQTFYRQLSEPDEFQTEETTGKESADSIKGELSVKSLSLSGQEDFKKHETKIRKYNVKKLDKIKNEFPLLIELIDEIDDICKTPIYFTLDDFYFINKLNQPFFIDFFHRLSKNTNLCIKICTIKHRSKLYVEAEKSYYGIEISQDAQEFDLDYNLNRFDELKKFMEKLLESCANSVGVELKIDKLFSKGGFNQLCLASGGVPRDFLSLFNKVVERFGAVKKNKNITKINVTEIAIENFSNKRDSFMKDSQEEKDVLEYSLNNIKNFVLNKKKTNMFLINNNSLELDPVAKQIIKELIDLRMIHLVEDTMSVPSDRGIYSAYMIDIGLYSSAKQPSNFKQIEPNYRDEKGRADKIRLAPKLEINMLHETAIQN